MPFLGEKNQSGKGMMSGILKLLSRQAILELLTQRIFLIFIVVMMCFKLQALVCDILPSTTAIVDYAIGPEKLSANERFFDDAQMAVSL